MCALLLLVIQSCGVESNLVRESVKFTSEDLLYRMVLRSLLGGSRGGIVSKQVSLNLRADVCVSCGWMLS
jgi:hypothetical protein